MSEEFNNNVESEEIDNIIVLNDENGDKTFRILTLNNEELKEIFKNNEGKTVSVLFETPKDGYQCGYTKNSGYCTALAANKDDATYIAVVLGYDEKTDSLSSAKSLLDIAFSQYRIVTPELPDNIPTEISVKGGLYRSVPVEYGKIRKVVLPYSATKNISSKIVIMDYVYAPIEKGHKVGEIQFFRNDKLMFYVDIVTKEDIDKTNVVKALNILLKNLLTF